MQLSTETRFHQSIAQLGLSLSDDYPNKNYIVSIYDHLLQMVGDDREALRFWMHQPQKRLDNRIPSVLLRDEAGLTDILRCLRKELEMDSLIG